MAIHCNFEMTNHARCRAQQRGVTHDTLNFVIAHSDVWLHAGEGSKTIRLSNRRLGELSREGYPGALIERATNVEVVIDSLSGSIITVLHDQGSTKSRKYRTQWPTRSHKCRQQRGRDLRNIAMFFPPYQDTQGKISIH